jgi:shikimate kinase
MTPRAVLVGLPGVGKSTTGRRLAKILGVPFADSDALVAERDGRGMAELLRTVGEPEARRIEAEVIAQALSDFDGVLALGGGALTTASTRERLRARGIAVIELRARIATLVQRVGDGSSRPLLAGDPPARLQQLADERGATFAELASFAVDTDGRTPGQVAASVAARLHEAGVAR